MSTVLNQRLGTAIRQKRVELGMTQSALAERVGVTFQQIQKYEKGRNQVGFPMLIAIAAAVNTSPAELIESAIGDASSVCETFSDRAAFELVKRIGTLPPNQREGLRLLINQLAGGVE